ncbi:NACHT domain-containing protein [Kitasatospora sp. NPDC088391]|uniref:NACHT domain-containing protein n=1 Tax=Kitasatospora sp. NPDC088391 TaxID=3364074 RepID=UPI00381B60D4
MRREVFPVRASRYCRVRADGSPSGSPDADLFPLDPDGFFADIPAFARPGDADRVGGLVAAADIADREAIVLLGEPGAGKTSLFRMLASDLPEWDDPALPASADRLLWIDGPELTPATYDEVLGRHLAALPTRTPGRTRAAGGVLTVVIDQLDESELVRSSGLPARLARSLRNKAPDALRLRVACRTGDYPARLTRVLHETFGSCALLDLAPLSRKDAVMLAESALTGTEGTDTGRGEQLVAEIVAVRAGALASVPLTLELMVRTYLTTGHLAGGALELFDSGVQLLAQEYDEERCPASPPSTTWLQRLEIAGRIAARLVLSGRRTLWQGTPLDGGPRATDLDVDTLPGGSERTPVDGKPFDVTPAALAETLATGLFTAAGPHRLAFRHSSIAAFLTARHLLARSVTDAELQRLFLVGNPGEEISGIPVPLRETASWLVALAPARTQWLASADPESLAMHSGLVRADNVKELIVGRLLERAVDVELGETWWPHTRWVLGHPGLSRQLLPALATDPADLTDWPTLARARVALRLAEQCPSAELTSPLLKVAANPAWPADDRAHAARNAMGCDPATAAPALRKVLADLAEDPDADRFHALRGSLLSLLWPRFLDTEAMLKALTAPPSYERYGLYENFLSTLPTTCPQNAVPQVLSWAVENISKPAGEGRIHGIIVIDERFSSEIIDRALSAPDWAAMIPDVARIAATRFLHHRKIEFPTALNPVLVDGSDPVEVREMRRALATAMLDHRSDTDEGGRYFAWLVIREWSSPHRSLFESLLPQGNRTTLLDSSDFAWALARAAECATDSRLADGYAHLASVLFDIDNREHFELAYHDQENPAWKYLSWFYQPFEIHGELAKIWRRNHRSSAAPTWSEREKFTAHQLLLWERVSSGDTDSFWMLLWNFQVDPDRGLIVPHFTVDIPEWPGSSVLPEEFLAELPVYALNFLQRENDHAEEWLGLGQEDKRAWAGLISLVLLENDNRLDDLPADRWGAWMGAIANGTLLSPETWDALLRRAVTHDPVGLARAIKTLSERQFSAGSESWVLERVEACWSPTVRAVVEDLFALLSAALVPGCCADRAADAAALWEAITEKRTDGRPALVRSWTKLLSRLLADGCPLALEIAEHALAVAGESSAAPEVDIAVIAAQLLLAHSASDAWPLFEELASMPEPFGRALALGLSQDDSRALIENHADESGLRETYYWLNRYFPAHHYVRPTGAYAVTPEMTAREWRDSLPGLLSRRGTPAAVAELRGLAAEFPDRLSLRAALVAARANCLAATWTPADLDEVVRVLSGAGRRSRPAQEEAALVEILQEFPDMMSREFRNGILRDMQTLMGSHGFLPVADHSIAVDYLRAIAAYVYGEGGPPARRALLAALAGARPDEGALVRLQALCAAE